MKSRFLALLAAALLAACASAPKENLLPRHQVGDFSIEARFALRVTAPEPTAQSSSGRLSWQHRGGDDHILVSNPLGYGVAEIDITPGNARLRTADGQTREAADADALLAEATGQRLPLTRLPDWLLGRSPDIRRDGSGRPQHLSEAGWQIDYAYEDDAAGALPSGLNVRREQDMELRLRIEEWKTP